MQTDHILLIYLFICTISARMNYFVTLKDTPGIPNEA
jgi:hypothetical protein